MARRKIEQKWIVSLCDHTGNALKPWACAGFNCLAVDLQHSISASVILRDGIHYAYGDCRSFNPRDVIGLGKIVFMCAFPPCTHLAVSGAKHFDAKGLRALTDALDIFNSCYLACNYSGAPYFIENPVGVISSHFRKPDFIFDPYQYACYADDSDLEEYTKRTCLWTGNGFVMPTPDPKAVPYMGSKMHTLGGARQYERSITPTGFSRAVYLANCRNV